MGIQRRNRHILFALVVLGFQFIMKAQEIEHIDINLIYNEWALSYSESTDDVLVYRDEDDFIFDGVTYDSSLNLKFKRDSDVCYLKATRSRKRVNRCGTRFRSMLNDQGQEVKWIKRKWALLFEDEGVFLILKHFEASSFGGYSLIKREEYKILDLNEDSMKLLKIMEQSTN